MGHGLFQIGENVFFVLDTHGEAEEAVMELRRVEVLALVVLPQGHSGGDDLQMADEPVMGIVVGVQAEGDRTPPMMA